MKIQYLAFLYGFLSSPALSIFGAPAYFAKRKYRLINSVQINFGNIALHTNGVYYRQRNTLNKFKTMGNLRGDLSFA